MFCSRATAESLPSPGVSVFFPLNELGKIRASIHSPPCQAVYEQLATEAKAALAKWPQDKTHLRLDELVPRLADLTMESVPAEFVPAGGREAGKALTDYAEQGAPAAAFVYLITGKRPYADFAWEVFQECARANRWGWFPWSGAHLPQIHFGLISRNMVLIADCIWDTLTPPQRQRAREIIAEKCVEPYYRLVLHTPGMGLYHLRSRNQGNNALAAALIGSLFVGEAVPDNDIWFNSLLQTYHWIITHDIGWMGQNLESGMPGYWSVSMQNLYTAAVALRNVRGIDLRAHPAFDQATYYPIIHEATVPPVNLFADPINTNQAAPMMGVISSKPIELPHEAYCGAWWLDYAVNFPASPAHYFTRKLMVKPERLLATDAHQGALSDVLELAWWDARLLEPARPPSNLAQFTDRMAGIRSGYHFGDTYLYFNGDLFLSARKEILATTCGLSWHFPWHQYQITESGVETEGEPFAPSMTIKEAIQDEEFTFFRAVADVSNATYYPQAGQRESYQHYERRERSVLYVRGTATRPDYFLFLDEVRQTEPRWHGWNWHLWNAQANGANYGRFEVKGPDSIRAERPNADVWIQFIEPEEVTVEQHGIPSQPYVNYQMDHNAQMMRAVAGRNSPVIDQRVIIPPSAWPDLGVERENALYLEKPPTGQTNFSRIVSGISGGQRYRWSLRCKKENYRVYEATAWVVDLEFLDADKRVVARAQTPYGHPDPLRLGAPRSDQPTHDWIETTQYFDAPAKAVACRANFRAVGNAHYFKLGQLWLGPIELEPMGIPLRTKAQRFLTLGMPLDKNAEPPKITRPGGKSAACLSHADGSIDEFTITADGRLEVTRRWGDKVVARFTPSPQTGATLDGTLKTNSEANAKELAHGLKPILDQLTDQRDAWTKMGRTNLALGAKVIASASLDERFSPDHVNDNQTSEYPLDGHLDYTQGVFWSSGRTVGYGQARESLLANREAWPFYVRPTYWLLPAEQFGWVEVELKSPATVDRVRLLNTSNAGLNDFATTRFRLELYDSQRKLVTAREGHFGNVFDRPFDQAFFVPQWFNHYTASFAGMLERGVPVPFGDGWKEMHFESATGVRFVRFVVTQYWSLGGGLNEIQVYGR